MTWYGALNFMLLEPKSVGRHCSALVVGVDRCFPVSGIVLDRYMQLSSLDLISTFLDRCFPVPDIVLHRYMLSFGLNVDLGRP